MFAPASRHSARFACCSRCWLMLLVLVSTRGPVCAAPVTPTGPALKDQAAADKAPEATGARLLYRRKHTTPPEAAGNDSAWSVRELVFSADGRRLLSRAEPSIPDRPRELLLWDTATGRVLSRISCGPGRLSSCDLSADGSRLLVGAAPDDDVAGGEIRLFDVASGEVRQRLESSEGLARFLPGSGELLTVTRFLTGDVLRRYRTDTGQENARSILPLSYRLQIAPAGDLLLSVASQRDPRLKLIEASTGRQLATLAGCTRTPAAMAISPDGSVCAASAGNGQVLVWERDTGLLLHRLAGHAGRTTALAFSHDSRQLASAGTDGTLHLWHVASGEKIFTAAAHEKLVSTVAFSPDDTRLASGSFDGTFAVWNTAAMPLPSLLAGPVTTEQIDQAWRDLSSAAPSTAWRALGQIDEQPAALLAGLHRHVREARLPEQDERIARLLRELDSPDFRTRHRATRQLRDLRQIARPALQRELAQTDSAEVRSRLRRILGPARDEPRFNETDHRRLRRLIRAAARHPLEDSTALLQLIAREYPEQSIAREAARVVATRND